jgi:hypothetical protein
VFTLENEGCIAPLRRERKRILRRELLTLPYLDPSLPKEDRAADLVSRVTEKEASGTLNCSAAVPRQLPFPVP